MSDEQVPAGTTVRRGKTGGDRSARDWAGSDEPEAPPGAEGAEADGQEVEAPRVEAEAEASGADGDAATAATVTAAEAGDATGATETTEATEATDTTDDDGDGSADDVDDADETAAGAAADAEAPGDGEPAIDADTGSATDAGPAAPAAPRLTAVPARSAPTDEEPTDAEPTDEEPLRTVVRATGPPRRPPMLVQGLWPALLAGGLVAATAFGLLPLTIAVLGLQVFLILGALALLDAPASGGAFLVAVGTVVVADVAVLTDDGRVTGLAGAAGLGLVASLLHQLLRRGRARVTESLADTLVVIVVSVAAACLLALRQVEGGEQVLLVSLCAGGSVLLAGRIGDRLAPQPILAAGSTRGWPGLLLGLGAGVAAAVVVADSGFGDGNLPLRSAALLGLVIASTVATADLAVDLGAAELRAGWRDARRVAALRPTALLLPYAVLGPVALLAGRLVLA